MRAPASKRSKKKPVAETIEPTGRRSDDEIVADIIKLSGCRGIKLVDSHDDRELVELYVWKLIEWLRTDLPPFTGNREQNRKFATKLRKQLDELECTLEKAAAVLGDRFWSLCWFQGTAIELNPQTRNYIEQDPLKRFREWLDLIRSRCDLMFGTHGGVKHLHEHAAKAGVEVLEAAASFAGGRHVRFEELGLGCSPTGRFCRIASLFLEAVTGEYDLDLRRACKAVVRLRAKPQK